MSDQVLAREVLADETRINYWLDVLKNNPNPDDQRRARKNLIALLRTPVPPPD